MAALCFETGRFEDAEVGYRTLLDSRDVPADHAVHADVLLSQGRFKEAHAGFLAYESSSEFPQAHWITKRIATEDIIARRDGADQERRVAEAQAQLDRSCSRVGETPDEQFVFEMLAVLDLDALNAAARRNLALATSSSFEEMAHGVGCAVGLGYDRAEAVMIAILWSNANFPDDIAALVGACYGQAVGKLGRYPDLALAEKCAEQALDPEIVRTRLEPYIPALAPTDPTFTARFADDEALGGYVAIDLPAAP